MAKLGTAPKKLITLIGAVLFFCLVASTSFAALPAVGTISPLSGTTTPNIAKTFTCTYSDTDGWLNIKEAYLLISTTTTTLTNSVYLYYDQNGNLLYLRDDSNTTWLGGFTPGSANTIENSYVILNCALSTVSGSANTLTVSYQITFKPAYSGKVYYTYLKVADDAGGATSWVRKGSYTVNNKPTIGTINPSSGTGKADIEQIFTTTFTDLDGWQNAQYVYFIINTSASGLNCLYAYYNQNTNKLYLRNDANTTWLGGYSPGSANTIENSYAKLNCASTAISGSDTSLTINWAVTLKAPFTGNKNTYLYIRDDANGYAGWTRVGTWSIPNNTPSVGIIIPQDGASKPDQAVNITTTFTDPDGWLNIQYVYLLINTSISGIKSFWGYYNQNTNKLYLRNDTNTSWLGGYAPGSSKIIENSYVKLNCSATIISGSDTTLTINWAITFKPTFLGTKNMYLYVRDDANAYQNWVKKGTWTIGGQTLSISVNPKLWDAGSTEINRIITMTPANKITVTNDGSGLETFTLSLVNPPGWTASTTPGRDIYVLSGIFCNSTDIPQSNQFNQDGSLEDVVSASSKAATQTIFGYAQSTASGVSVPPGGGRSLYLQFKSPTATDKTTEQNISVIVSCQIS